MFLAVVCLSLPLPHSLSLFAGCLNHLVECTVAVYHIRLGGPPQTEPSSALLDQSGSVYELCDEYVAQLVHTNTKFNIIISKSTTPNYISTHHTTYVAFNVDSCPMLQEKLDSFIVILIHGEMERDPSVL